MGIRETNNVLLLHRMHGAFFCVEDSVRWTFWSGCFVWLGKGPDCAKQGNQGECEAKNGAIEAKAS
jgi:hypothetical protein